MITHNPSFFEVAAKYLDNHKAIQLGIHNNQLVVPSTNRRIKEGEYVADISFSMGDRHPHIVIYHVTGRGSTYYGSGRNPSMVRLARDYAWISLHEEKPELKDKTLTPITSYHPRVEPKVVKHGNIYLARKSDSEIGAIIKELEKELGPKVVRRARS
jgi:hypothetical protein